MRGLVMRHYFPRFTTPAGRESIDKGKLAEEFIPSEVDDIEDPLLFLVESLTAAHVSILRKR